MPVRAAEDGLGPYLEKKRPRRKKNERPRVDRLLGKGGDKRERTKTHPRHNCKIPNIECMIDEVDHVTSVHVPPLSGISSGFSCSHRNPATDISHPRLSHYFVSHQKISRWITQLTTESPWLRLSKGTLREDVSGTTPLPKPSPTEKQKYHETLE